MFLGSVPRLGILLQSLKIPPNSFRGPAGLKTPPCRRRHRSLRVSVVAGRRFKPAEGSKQRRPPPSNYNGKSPICQVLSYVQTASRRASGLETSGSFACSLQSRSPHPKVNPLKWQPVSHRS